MAKKKNNLDMSSIEELKKRISKIEERNKNVETDKAWEKSLTRRVLLIVFTYLAVGIYFQAINISKPWLNAIVPSFAFLLSTLTFPFLKIFWKKYFYKK